MHQHTFDLMKTQSQPEIIDRRARDVWEAAGATTAYERAVKKAQWILENHKPEPLPDEVLATIRSIVVETEKELGVKS
jgi:trimethylamine--corrinoid protein Co-methyltransferase